MVILCWVKINPYYPHRIYVWDITYSFTININHS